MLHYGKAGAPAMTKPLQAFDSMRANLSRLASGSLVSQAIMVGSTPLLTRLFNADAFGVLAVFSATYAIAIPFTTLKYDAALILPKSVDSAVRLTALVVLIATSLALLAGATLLAAAQWWPQLAPSVSLWLPLALWLGAMYTLMQQWSARRSNYRDFARSMVVGAALNVGTGLSLGYLFGGKPAFLILGMVCGMGGSLAYMCWRRRAHRLPALPKGALGGLFKRARVYRQFPALVLPTSLMLTIGQSSMPLILTANYPLADVGQFAIANRLLLVPTALIGGALAEAFRAEFVKRQRDRQAVRGLFTRTVRTLAMVALPLFGFLALTAPFLFALVFGASYERAGLVAQAVVLGVAAQFIGNPFASVFVAMRKAATGLRIQAATTVLPLLLLLAAGILHLPLATALGIYSAACAVSIGAMLILVGRLCKASDATLATRSGP